MAAITEFKRWITHAQTPRVQQMLKQAADSNMISFAGGLPAEELFPAQAIEAAFSDVITQNASEALQYNWSEGYGPLREQIAARMSARGMKSSAAQILITHGAQQALDLLSKMLAREGDPIALESPTYVPAIQAFELQHLSFEVISRNKNGIDCGELRAALRRGRPKFIYLVPSGHNPTGSSLNLDQRLEIIREAAETETVVIEDDAYGELQYEATHAPLKALSQDERIVFVGSFSKILSPGLRVGWIASGENVISQLSLIKQASDLQTGTLNQMVLSRYLQQNSIDDHVGRCIEFYRQRRDAMLRSLNDHFPSGLSWTRPDSGFSIWVELPDAINAEDLLKESISQRVAFEPGKPFFAQAQRDNFMRLSFSNQPSERIEKGIIKISNILKQHAYLYD